MFFSQDLEDILWGIFVLISQFSGFTARTEIAFNSICQDMLVKKKRAANPLETRNHFGFFQTPFSEISQQPSGSHYALPACKITVIPNPSLGNINFHCPVGFLSFFLCYSYLNSWKCLRQCCVTVFYRLLETNCLWWDS